MQWNVEKPARLTIRVLWFLFLIMRQVPRPWNVTASKSFFYITYSLENYYQPSCALGLHRDDDFFTQVYHKVSKNAFNVLTGVGARDAQNKKQSSYILKRAWIGLQVLARWRGRGGRRATSCRSQFTSLPGSLRLKHCNSAKLPWQNIHKANKLMVIAFQPSEIDGKRVQLVTTKFYDISA